jgi:hypothetical protein
MCLRRVTAGAKIFQQRSKQSDATHFHVSKLAQRCRKNSKKHSFGRKVIKVGRKHSAIGRELTKSGRKHLQVGRKHHPNGRKTKTSR